MSISVVKGDIVDFYLEEGSILFSKKTGVQVTGVVTYTVAKIIDPEINSKHIAMYPYFASKVGNVNDPSKYDYVVFRNLNGVEEVIGIPWIKYSTYEPVTTRTGTIIISNFKESFRAPLQTYLANLGANFTMTVSND